MHKFIGTVRADGRNMAGEKLSLLDKYLANYSRAAYEVIRIIRGKPLFFNEHFDRLTKSCGKLSIERSVLAEAIDEMYQVIDMNDYEEKNIKILVGVVDDKPFIIVGYIESFYPPRELYEKGASVRLYSAERICPQVKKEDPLYRSLIDRAKEEYGVNELLIYNHNGIVTEGSTSSFFYMIGGRLFVPDRTMALQGVTQGKVLEICEGRGIPVEEHLLNREDISSIEAGFLTGTSIGVLPIRDIDGEHVIESARNETIKILMEGYSDFLEKSIV